MTPELEPLQLPAGIRFDNMLFLPLISGIPVLSKQVRKKLTFNIELLFSLAHFEKKIQTQQPDWIHLRDFIYFKVTG